MATNFKNDSSQSRSWFNRFVVPALSRFGFSDICSAENHESELDSLLDLAGIDALAKRGDGATVSFASRIIQMKPNLGNYDCFSLRDARSSGHTTEFEKLQNAIKFNSLRPMWHVQTFVDKENDEAHVSIVDTKSLVEVAATDSKILTTRDKTVFRLVPFADLRRAGVEIQTVNIKAKKNKAMSLLA